MANEISKPTSPWSQVMHIAERVLTDRRLIVLKNIVFILVLLNYWSYFYAKFAVGGPVRAFKDLHLYVKRVCCPPSFYSTLCLFIHVLFAIGYFQAIASIAFSPSQD